MGRTVTEEIREKLRVASEKELLEVYFSKLSEYMEEVQVLIWDEVKSRNIDTATLENIENEAQKQREISSVQTLTGVGGWLLIYLVGTFLTAGLFLLQLITDILSARLFSIDFWYLLVTAAFIIIANLFILQRKMAGKYLAIGYFSFLVLLTIVGLLANLQAVSTNQFLTFAWPIAVSTIWIAYFSTSRRVKLTLVN